MDNEFKKRSPDQEEINKKLKCKSFIKKFKVSLKYRPDVLKYILKLRHCLKMKNKVISKYRKKLGDKSSSKLTKSQACQTEKMFHQNSNIKVDSYTDDVWDVCGNSDDKIVSIADQVKEAAQNALAESGMVYVESAGMYYDYKTGYYYNSELGLYYHTSTGCYYAYSNDDKSFTFHSYADNSKFLAENKAHVAHEKKKAKRQRKDKEDDAKDEVKMKRKKCSNSNSINEESKVQGIENMTKDGDHFDTEPKIDATDINCDDSVLKQPLLKKSKPKSDNTGDLEDGECSETDSDLFESNTSTATVSDDDSVARHHPPCMRIIVRETNLSKLKVGTLFLITKDGGTIGREGDTHTVLLKDHNVSRNHLDIKYDNVKRAYVATDLGSKNGTILNGTRMSESQEISFPTEIPHGSILQVGETKLLCHIHLGNDTCGHCEPGLVMAAEDEEKRVAYTRTCSVQKQHQLELARLKNKYAPEPLAIEDSSYNDRAKARREKFGSSHHAEKTQQSDLETSITSENKGFQLMEKMGWSKGEGLGKDSQGDTEPVPLLSNESKAGLGASGSANPVSTVAAGSARPMRLTARAKPLRPPASLFRDPLEDDDD